MDLHKRKKKVEEKLTFSKKPPNFDPRKGITWLLTLALALPLTAIAIVLQPAVLLQSLAMKTVDKLIQ